ncbi:hypothetical protein BgiMline_022063 [Biomphalaria glabrata]|nr:hypothetical protein BgiMline_009953 [Biomphalaria glabrata]
MHPTSQNVQLFANTRKCIVLYVTGISRDVCQQKPNSGIRHVQAVTGDKSYVKSGLPPEWCYPTYRDDIMEYRVIGLIGLNVFYLISSL